jgi:heat shock protein HslJ
MKIKLITFGFLLVLLSACSVLPAADSLEGTSWKLYAISKHRPIEGSNITIVFADGQVSGRGGCNQYGGEYQINGSMLTIDKLYMTEMACISPVGIMDQETTFLKHLGNTQRFEIVDGQLQIYWSEHEALTFIPAD